MEFPDSINFSREEENTQKFWKENRIFEKSLEQSKHRPRYTFYDGPPFATGLPHYGHLLAGSIKDIRTRFAHQEGFHVERRFGWDCHGLPVEYEIDKSLGITGPADILKMGIDVYNSKCRSIVMRYSEEWERVVDRMGRWIDFKNDYKTMYPWFMESVWWVFKQMYEKGLVYHGEKVMPFSTACSTPLSNFEAGQNYKEVQDPAVIVSFPLDDEPDVSLLAWTTTPWTLPSNLALCVNPEMEYVKVKDKASGKVYILMESLIGAVYKSQDKYSVVSEKFLGKTLVGKTYKPLFPYFEKLKSSRGAFRVVSDGYVTADSGTGVVHQAPYFGEDDHRVCLSYGIINKDSESVCPVNEKGVFVEPVTDFQGQYVKEADKNIIRKLKEMGRLVVQSTCVHNYPFCWRSDTPLIYKAVPTWFVRVEELRDRLLKNNAKTHWVPDFVKEKRFANWLSNARDWAISRNRFWGTPIPLWVSEDLKEVVCVGSREELRQLAGLDASVPLDDLHREFVDKITIPSKHGNGVLRRISEVFDCWFESGSMPYAQQHYPFERQEEFMRGFPADFIAEGIDQTRGWFYTLLVVSTALFDSPPFKHLIVNGIVLNEHGEKMSKRMRNYPDPDHIINTYGADSLRLYLINSPVVRAEDMRFKEADVKEVLRSAFLPWYNACRFLMHTNVPACERRMALAPGSLLFSVKNPPLSKNIMDQWIVSSVHSLMNFVRMEMNEYRLYTVLPRLVKFIDQLTNWYVRMNRKRMRGDTSDSTEEDCVTALHTCFYVLYHMCVLFAPFVPFFTEFLYQRLRPRVKPERTGLSESNQDSAVDSVHFRLLLSTEECVRHISPEIEEKMRNMQNVVELGRQARDRRALGLRCPLKEVVVIHREEIVLNNLLQLEHYIKDELNVRTLTVATDKSRYGVQLRAIPDFRRLGPRLKGDFKQVDAVLKALSTEELDKFLQTGEMTVKNHVLTNEDVQVVYFMSSATSNKKENAKEAVKEKASQNGDKKSKKGAQSKAPPEPAQPAGELNKFEAHSDNAGLLVLLNCEEDTELAREFLARELMNRIQKLRKQGKLSPSDAISVVYDTKSEEMLHLLSDPSLKQFIEKSLQVPLFNTAPSSVGPLIVEATVQVDEKDIHLRLYWQTAPAASSTLNGVTPKPSANISSTQSTVACACRYVNIHLVDSSNSPRVATILLENPRNDNILNLKQLHFAASSLFGRSLRLYATREDLENEVEISLRLGVQDGELFQLHEKTIFAVQNI